MLDVSAVFEILQRRVSQGQRSLEDSATSGHRYSCNVAASGYFYLRVVEGVESACGVFVVVGVFP